MRVAKRPARGLPADADTSVYMGNSESHRASCHEKFLLPARPVFVQSSRDGRSLQAPRVSSTELRRMRYLILTSLLLGSLAPIPQAKAADSPKAREKSAKRACAAGDFQRGIEILADLWVDTNEPIHIYNQGRCYEQNHQWASAIDRFREYLRKDTNASASDKAEVDKHIGECEAFLEKEHSKATTAAPLVPVPAPQPAASPPSPPMPPPPVNIASPVPATAEGNKGAGLRLTGIVLGSVGAAALVAGVILNAKANSLADDFNKTQNPSTQSSQSSYKTASMIGYGAGIGVLVAGGVLYLIGRTSANANPVQASFVPILTPGEFSLHLRRTF